MNVSQKFLQEENLTELLSILRRQEPELNNRVSFKKN